MIIAPLTPQLWGEQDMPKVQSPPELGDLGGAPAQVFKNQAVAKLARASWATASTGSFAKSCKRVWASVPRCLSAWTTR